MLPITLGPTRVANGAGLDVRARPASKVVGGEWGHVSRMQDSGCSRLGDDLKTAWTLGGGDPKGSSGHEPSSGGITSPDRSVREETDSERATPGS
jgi:hypothetical protein